MNGNPLEDHWRASPLLLSSVAGETGRVEAAPAVGTTATESSCSLFSRQSQDAMNGETLRRKVTITDPLGLHLRPLTAFAQQAGRFQCSVTLAKDNQRVNGKSPLELMLLGAQQGTELVLEVSGPDA